MSENIREVDLNGQVHYRIIPSTFPTINFFEDLVDPSEMETLIEIESMTNERIRQEVGDVFLVPHEDRISGPGSSVVMAAFTHIYKPSRFTDGSFGIYYAGLSFETAIKETVFHREIFLKATNQEAGEVAMRVYEGEIKKPLADLRAQRFKKFHHPTDFSASQPFGKIHKQNKCWGLIYNSVRHPGGTCIAAFRPPAISIPKQICHLKYYWTGERISAVFDTKVIFKFDEVK